MNKPALKRFATEARRELLERVEIQARKNGITSEGVQKATIESSDAIFINGRQLKEKEKVQRNKLIARIREIGFERVMEEAAYTWFNRFTALRFMEVNDYLPTKVRVLSSVNAESAEPDMMKEAMSLDLDLDKEYIYELKLANNNDELFKYLIIKHCNDLNRYMPFMFETIDDYTEILFPAGLLGTDSFVHEMTNIKVLSENNWEKIEVIGWLYQYYIAEEKDRIFADLKKNIKITKDTLPPATQLFTPNWIVKYMVENSLGRIWLESYPESGLKSSWNYYLEEAEQEADILKQLEDIRYKNVNPEKITFLDPSCGSGHILVYAFDVFFDMYLEKGYIESEIPQLILEKNLFGLEIDNRAAQLASFAIMMKAREKSRKIFRNPIQLNICAIEESNWLTDDMITNISLDNIHVHEMLLSIKKTFLDAKEYGSLLNVSSQNEELLQKTFQKYLEGEVDLLEMLDKEIAEDKLSRILKQTFLMSKKYDVVCTNPPYMGKSGMNPDLASFLSKNYPDSKNDLFAAFIEKGFELSKESGFNSMVTMQSWMFLSSYEKMRKNIIEQKTISTLLHMDNMVMGIAFGTAATVLRNDHIDQFKGTFTEVKYRDLKMDGQPKRFPIKENNNSIVSARDFKKIPGSPIAFWVSEEVKEVFEKSIYFKEFAYSFQGMITGNNNKYLRLWFETDFSKVAFKYSEISQVNNDEKKWIPYNKGGSNRKWYGNNEYVVLWENDGKHLTRARTENKDYYLKKGITWSFLTSSEFSARYFGDGFLWDVAGSSIFVVNNKYSIEEMLAFMNSKVSNYILKIYNPTLNFQVENIINLPYLQPIKEVSKINEITKENISISKRDWDSYETSWDFSKHPLLIYRSNSLENSLIKWKEAKNEMIHKLKINEENLNRYFIETYALNDILDYEVNLNEIGLQKFSPLDEMKSFISYAIGCTFGRYSLDDEGIVYAGGNFDSSKYIKFLVDEDNILPVLNNAYFEDDIVTRFVEFISVNFGEESLERNLNFAATALEQKKNETARETLRRYFINEFYKDHVQAYKKRPIYWLFTSGKEKAFNCLVYMHRYDKTTLSRIRTDYLHEVQTRMDSEKKDLLNIIEGDSSTKELSNAKKELKSLDKKIDELKAYDELLHHMADMQIEIDLDDGVAVNYAKFKGLVAKI